MAEAKRFVNALCHLVCSPSELEFVEFGEMRISGELKRYLQFMVGFDKDMFVYKNAWHNRRCALSFVAD